MKQENVLKESLGNFLRNAYDLLVLNWLWLLCSLPVVTAGPATVALYTVTQKLVREEPAYLVKDFFKAFKEDFWKSVAMGFLVGIPALVAVVDAWFAVQQTGAMQALFLTVAFLVGLVFLTLLGHGFAVQARFRNSLKKHISNAFSLVFVAPGKTLQIWCILLFPVLLALCLLLPAAVSAETAATNECYNWYEIFVYSYQDSNGDGIGDFNGLISRLDYIADMGMSQMPL